MWQAGIPHFHPNRISKRPPTLRLRQPAQIPQPIFHRAPLAVVPPAQAAARSPALGSRGCSIWMKRPSKREPLSDFGSGRTRGSYCLRASRRSGGRGTRSSPVGTLIWSSMSAATAHMMQPSNRYSSCLSKKKLRQGGNVLSFVVILHSLVTCGHDAGYIDRACSAVNQLFLKCQFRDPY